MNWRKAKISSFAEVITGGTPSTIVKDYWDNGNIPWLNSGDLNKGIINEASNFITELGLKNSSTRMMPPNSILIALTGATTGLTALLKIDACANQSVTGILPSKEHYPEFLYYFFKTQREKILRVAWGGAQPHINQKYIKDYIVPLPPLHDQIKIANILSKAEALIVQRKESIKLLDDFLKSTFLDMFGDPFLNPKKWELKKFGEHIEYIGDIGSNGSNETIAKNLVMHDTENYALMIRTVNLNSNNFRTNLKYFSRETYDFFKKSKIYGGEIIMNKIGSAGDFWIMPNLGRPVSLGLNQLVIRLKNLNTFYLYYFLSTNYGKVNIKSRIRGCTTKSITKSAVKELPLLYPPIELQTQFAEIVEKTETLKSKYKESLKELENLYASLSQKAFSGQLTIDNG